MHYTIKRGGQELEIEVGWKQFLPAERQAQQKALAMSQKAVIYIPGWGYDEQSQTVAKICQTFADTFGRTTYAVDTFAKQRPPATLMDEAEADRLFLREKGITESVVIGFSQGGVQATHLAKNNPSVTLLVLLNTTGLHEQSLFHFVANFAKEAFREGIKSRTVLWTLQDEQVRQEKMIYLQEHIARSGGVLRYFSPFNGRGKSECVDQLLLNASAKDVHAPVLVVLGKNDTLARPTKVFPSDSLPYLKGKTARNDRLRHIFISSLEVRGLVLPIAHELPSHKISSFSRAIATFEQEMRREKIEGREDGSV